MGGTTSPHLDDHIKTELAKVTKYEALKETCQAYNTYVINAKVENLLRRKQGATPEEIEATREKYKLVPFTEAEVEAIEIEFGGRICNDLRFYMLNISRVFFSDLDFKIEVVGKEQLKLTDIFTYTGDFEIVGRHFVRSNIRDRGFKSYFYKNLSTRLTYSIYVHAQRQAQIAFAGVQNFARWERQERLKKEEKREARKARPKGKSDRTTKVSIWFEFKKPE
jgi:hypothetical protein